MAKKNAVENAVKENAVVKKSYGDLIQTGELNNQMAQNFILITGNEMQKGATQKEVEASMKSLLKNVDVRPVVLPNHVPAIPTACLIMQKFETELTGIKASEILSLAVRTLYDVKASGVKSAIAGCKTFAELDEKILTKKESQSRDAGNKVKTDTKTLAKNITLEAVVDNLRDYLKACGNLKDKKTAEPQKLNEVIGILYTIYQNSKTESPVKASK